MFDLIIIGGGPAGIGAGIYAGRKKIKTLLVTDTFGGQSITSADVQNFAGIKSISGYDLANQLEEHLRAQEGIEIIDGDLVVKISPISPISPIGPIPPISPIGPIPPISPISPIPPISPISPISPIPPISPISPIPPISPIGPIPPGFYISTKGGKTLETKTILLVMGSKRRKLGVPGEKEFDGKGVAYCGTCDAPMFRDKKVAVVGAGNAGLETVIDLLPYASEIFLIVRSERIKGDPATLEKIRANPKVKIYFNTEVQEIFGGTMMKGLKYRNTETGELGALDVDGIFEEIGWIPNSEIVKDLVALGSYGEIIIDHKTQKTSHEGIWAAGDITDVLYKQNNISIGDGIKAVLNIYTYLNKSY